jgi:hypothetical protein
LNVEGRGIVAPKPIRVVIPRDAILIIKDRAAQQAMERDYRSRRDSWGHGLTGPGRPPNAADLRDDAFPNFVGGMCEYGVTELINRQFRRTVIAMDLRSRVRGDGGIDMKSFGLTVQVKSRQKPENPNLIRRYFRNGWVVPLGADVHIFCLYRRDDQDAVSVLGWAWTRKLELQGYEIVPARRGEHVNIEVPDVDLEPMSRLIKELRQREIS